MTKARVGHRAPAFDLPCAPSPPEGADRARLDDYAGRWLILIFYPRDFSLICPTELLALGARIDEFDRQGASLLGLSTDPVETHEQWLELPRAQGGLAGLGFPLASDEDGAVARAYGVYIETQHACLRGLFLIDPNGVLQYQAVHNLSVGRRAADVLRVLAALQTGGLCATDWQPGDANLDPTQVLRPGSVVSHYRIDAIVGSGTFGAVFRAHDLNLHRTVALKVLKTGAPHSALEEARSVAALIHPNICTVFGVDHGEGVPLIAMEYLAGQSLARLLTRDAPLTPSRVLSIARQVAAGLAAAHALGIVHGDLKPENILITRDGLVKLVDFGLAGTRSFDPDATLDHTPGSASPPPSAFGVSGTPAYMAPEQTRGNPPSTASDVFAFGLLIYELCHGRSPFQADNMLQLFDQIRAVVPGRLAASLPEPFRPIASAALQPRPEDRPTISEIVRRLDTPSDRSTATPTSE